MEIDERRAVILAAGDYPTHRIPLEALEGTPYLCCCDGAAREALARGLHPDAIVGDGDSLPPELKERCGGIFHHVAEQEYNDLTKATRFCKARGFTAITYVGATGKREDHTLGNISLLAYYARQLGIAPLMLTDHGSFSVVSGTKTLTSFPRQQVSIFNVSCTEISSEGLRWPCYAYREPWQGTLNEALAREFTLRTDGTCIVFQTYGAKG